MILHRVPILVKKIPFPLSKASHSIPTTIVLQIVRMTRVANQLMLTPRSKVTMFVGLPGPIYRSKMTLFALQMLRVFRYSFAFEFRLPEIFLDPGKSFARDSGPRIESLGIPISHLTSGAIDAQPG